jgi:rRNA-processing protein FCF1
MIPSLTDIHELRDAKVTVLEAVADELQQLARDERGGLRVVEAQTAR